METLALKRRGSVSVMAMIMVLATMSIAIVMVTLSGSVRTRQTRQETQRIVENAWDGGIEIVQDMAVRGVIQPPQTLQLSVGEVQQSISIEDAAPSLNLLGITLGPKTKLILVNCTLSYKGETYRRKEVLGAGAPKVWSYAIFSDSALTSFYSVRTGSAGLEGDAHFNGLLNLISFGTHFGGNLSATGTILPPTMNVDGTMTQLAPAVDFPGVQKTDYSGAATVTLPNNATLNGYAFPAPTIDGYALLYEDAGLTVRGAFSGSGTIYVQGNVTINGNITVTPGQHLAIIASGDVTVSGTVSTIGAYIYSKKALKVQSGFGTLTFTSGVVVSSIELSRGISASFDPFARDNPEGAFFLKLPGVWP